MSETTDDFLEHFGVRGMKWGRRSGGSGGSGGGGGKTSSSKANLKSARKEVLKGAWSSTKASKGKSVASGIILGPSYVAGVNLAKSAGYSKGKARAIGFLGGAPGGLIVAELSARKAAREAD